MKHRGLLKHCALLFIFIHWRSVCCAPTQTSCTQDNLDKLKDGTNLMRGEAKNLLDTYLNIHLYKDYNGSFQNSVPDSTITGVTIHEKLQSIYSKNELFKFHLEKLKEDDKNHWNSVMQSSLSNMTHRLWHHRGLLNQMVSATSWPSPATTPSIPSHSDGFKIKEYGWGVLYRLEEWSKAVLQVLEETNLCHSV